MTKEKTTEISIGSANDDFPSTITWSPTTEGEYYTSGINPTYSVSSDDLGIGTNVGTYTINTDTIDWNYPGNEFQLDPDLINSNPTCKALWQQFKYVYDMVKADKDNEE